jgi:hypothetical protein
MRIAVKFFAAAVLTLAQPQSFDKYTYLPPTATPARRPTAPHNSLGVVDTLNTQNKSRALVSLYVLRYPERYVGILQLMPKEQAV